MAEIRIIGIIPALNEEKTISLVVSGVKQHVDEAIVIDDGSRDNTRFLAKKAGAVVIAHEETRGYGKSLNDGFKLAEKRGGTIVFTFDADGQHEPSDIPKMLKPLLIDKADIVVGMRPEYARFAERAFASYTKRKLGISDPFCGFKAYKIEVYRKIGYFERVPSIGTQLMIQAKKAGFRIVQRKVKINQREDESRFGKRLSANFKILKSSLRMVLEG